MPNSRNCATKCGFLYLIKPVIISLPRTVPKHGEANFVECG